MNAINRQIHPEIRVLDEAQGLVEYVASDETLEPSSACDGVTVKLSMRRPA